jgi:hypothetical protein
MTARKRRKAPAAGRHSHLCSSCQKTFECEGKECAEFVWQRCPDCSGLGGIVGQDDDGDDEGGSGSRGPPAGR